MAAVEEFCMAAKKKWPNVLIQFEDFPTDKAFDILDHMRDKVLCFNGKLPSCQPHAVFCCSAGSLPCTVGILTSHADTFSRLLEDVDSRRPDHCLTQGTQALAGSECLTVFITHADDIQGTGAVTTAG